MNEVAQWVVYLLATVEEPIATYVGATVDRDRRLRQHNGELVGGARATSRRPGGWYRVCCIAGFADNHEALRFEWRWKHVARKLKGSPLTRRQKALERLLEKQENKHLRIETE